MSRRARRPAATEEGREQQLVSLAYDFAEKQMLEGTASSQIVAHFLKMGSTRERLERDRLIRENELLQAKVQQLANASKSEEMYAEALRAMRRYQGQEEEEAYDYDKGDFYE